MIKFPQNPHPAAVAALNVIPFMPEQKAEPVGLPWTLGNEWFPLDTGDMLDVRLDGDLTRPFVVITPYAKTGPNGFREMAKITLSLEDLRAFGTHLVECHEEVQEILGKVTA